jgi:hypothetical protein
MKPSLAVAASLLAVAPSLALAQQASPVMSALRAEQARYERNLVGAAETMPADKYGTRPTEQQASFAHLVLHVAQSNTTLCASISGRNAPDLGAVGEDSGKEALVGALKRSFAFCRDSLARVSDSELAQRVPSFDGPATRAAVVLDLATDWGDHYSLVATEMRLAGLLPPSAQRAGR